ncbi:MAG: SDR family oxidoreductase [Prevotellaceae bacterium]|jgi:short-subunit dehydrogenase|nr:SDR family oxidoreductase [Prevotellaceae bacterium]
MKNKNSAFTALITGASSGIGRELAKIHAEKGGNLVLVARNIANLNELKSQLETQFGINVTVIAKDLTLPDAPQEVYDEVISKNIRVDFLINNAGFADNHAFATADRTKLYGMIDLNIRALSEFIRLFLPDMLQRRSGKILNTASVAAYMPGPYMATYFATKSYVLSLSAAIAREVNKSGVSVTTLCPGPTDSQFWEVAGMDNSKYLKMIKLPSAHFVAKTAYKAMLKGQKTVIPCRWNKTLVGLVRFLPRSWVSAIAAKLMMPQNVK